MAARFENGGDHDIHAEIADEPVWSSENHHIIVEIHPARLTVPLASSFGLGGSELPTNLDTHRRQPLQRIVDSRLAIIVGESPYLKRARLLLWHD